VGELGIEIVNGLLGHCILVVAWSLGVRRVTKGGAICFIDARLKVDSSETKESVFRKNFDVMPK